MNRLAINLVAFQLGWFSSVLGAANGFPLLGPLVVLAVVMLHLGMADQPGRELILIAIAGLLGALFDSALVRTGWLTYINGVIWVGTAPYWIVAMWLSFATTLNVSLKWLRKRPWAAVALGAIGGPASYLAGEQLGAIDITHPGAALTALALGWAFVIPALVILATRLDGITSPASEAPQHA